MSEEKLFEVLEELGRGGMGVVYKARDTVLGREVALKILPSQLTQNETLVKRFRREATAAAGLNHPNIVTVYSIGKQDGSFYIAMEYVKGMSLAELIRAEGPQEPRRAIEFVKATADALAEAHSKKIVHRDIKPHNIMLDVKGRIKVADFGLARVMQADTELTADGTRLGTPRYMSPEQVEAKPLTPHSDIYSLGVVLYELLAAEPAFQAETTIQIMRQIVDGAFPDIMQVKGDTPPEVGRIIAKMVAKHPEDRYPSAIALSKDLDSWLATGLAPRAAGADISELGAGTAAFVSGVPALVRREKDILLHFVDPDRTWAEWIETQLTEVGYKIEMMEWDYKNSAESLRQVLKFSEKGTAIFVVASPKYMLTLHGDNVWIQAYAQGQVKVLPIAVRATKIGVAFRTMIYLDISKMDRKQASEVILEEARERCGDPDVTEIGANFKDFLEDQGPGKLLHALWNVPYAQNPHYTGRGQILTNVYRALNERGGVATLVQENPEHSGYGLTQLAVEYAQMNKSNYSAVWWVRGETRASLILDYSKLAVEAGLPEKDAKKFGVQKKAVKNWLKDNDNWLVIFDHIETPQDLAGFIPKEKQGHVIITSPSRKWPKNANPITITGLERNESIDFLFKRTGQRNDGAAAALAAVLADVPLTLMISGAYIDATGTSLDSYIDLFLTRHKAFWGFADPPKDSKSVTMTALSLSLERIALESRGALDLLKACAYLAPTNIRLARLSSGAKQFPKTLTKTLTTTSKLNESVATLKRYSLAEEKADALWFHPMVQELVCTLLEKDLKTEEHEDISDLVSLIRYSRFEKKDPKAWPEALLQFIDEAFPEETNNPELWPEHELFISHALSVARHNVRVGGKPKATAELWRRLGAYSYERAEYETAIEAFERSIALHKKGFGEKHKGLSRLHKELAHIHRAKGDLRQARINYEAALVVDQATHGDKAHEDMATTLSHLGNVLMELGDYASARRQYLHAAEMDKKVHGPRHADVGRDYTYLGLVSQQLGDLTAAWEYYREALEISEQVHGPEHAQVAAAVKNAAGLMQKMGDLVKAKEYYERAVKIDTKVHGEQHPELAQDYNNLGTVLQGLGFIREALGYYRKALAIDEAVYGNKHPKVAINMNNIANILRGQGDIEGAEAYYKDAAKIFKGTLGSNHDSTKTALRNLKKIHLQIRQAKSGPKVEQ